MAEADILLCCVDYLYYLSGLVLGLGLKVLIEYVLMYQAKGAFKAVIVSCGPRL